MRKLVTVRKIAAVDPITGADAIEVATVDGWKVVVKKGEFNVGDPCVYFEIDSFLPTGNPAWQFLVDKQGREFEGVYGHRLRTIKLRGQISQGFVMPLQKLDKVAEHVRDLQLALGNEKGMDKARQIDFSEILGIKKWEAPLSAELAGQAEGYFPSFIQKTDQERCQNLQEEIFGFEKTTKLIEGVKPEQIDQEAIDADRIRIIDGQVYSVHEPKGDPLALYEVTMKLDGSSMTAFINKESDGEVKLGVCSRNLQLKLNDANKDNSFVRLFYSSELNVALTNFYMTTGRSIAIQGELMGPGIQGNREGLKVPTLFVFDIYDIDRGQYLTPKERTEVFWFIKKHAPTIEHVPIVSPAANLFGDFDIQNVDDLLKFADGPSINNPVREGLVFKRLDGKFSFKSISNVFLAKEKD